MTTGTTLYLRSASLSTDSVHSMPSTASRGGTASRAAAAPPLLPPFLPPFLPLLLPYTASASARSCRAGGEVERECRGGISALGGLAGCMAPALAACLTATSTAPQSGSLAFSSASALWVSS